MPGLSNVQVYSVDSQYSRPTLTPYAIAAQQFGNFELKVDWTVTKKSDNSGVFVRFPAPTVANEPGGDPRVAINQGYEIQIDDEGAPDGDMIHKTGAIYGVQPPEKIASEQAGEWNTFLIRLEGQIYNVTLTANR